ncbi:MAG: orotidine-5'-phosphate decarboxylase [Bacteroidales bacterium]|nr:orotidine-5'-phosphate decarboxylase [Bacteroidales bacterium]
MNRREIYQEIHKKKSFLCVGLDSDIQKLPAVVKNDPDPIFRFNKEIVDATHEYAVAYKPNLAFYEALGSKGLISLEKTVDYIRSVDPSLFIIADAKRGDIGNTANQYARAFFVHFDFDAITLSPYMGRDSIEPFLDYPDKWVIILALTSNRGAEDFEKKQLIGSTFLYEEVIQSSMSWGNPDNLMFVVGATQSEYLQSIRELAPDNFFLVPGVGAQGGDLESVIESGQNSTGGLLINSSRGIIFASDEADFSEKAGLAAASLQKSMSKYF